MVCSSNTKQISESAIRIRPDVRDADNSMLTRPMLTRVSCYLLYAHVAMCTGCSSQCATPTGEADRSSRVTLLTSFSGFLYWNSADTRKATPAATHMSAESFSGHSGHSVSSTDFSQGLFRRFAAC